MKRRLAAVLTERTSGLKSLCDNSRGRTSAAKAVLQALLYGTVETVPLRKIEVITQTLKPSPHYH